jgi:hypothetical protein
MQNAKVPLKKLTPRIAKIKIKRPQTIVTFVIEGKEDNKAFTISFMPLFLEIILNGLSALRALNAFKDCKLLAILALSAALTLLDAPI